MNPLQPPNNHRKLPASKTSDVISRRGRDEIISRLNPLQDIRAHIGIKNKTSYGDNYVDIEIDGATITGGSQGPSGSVTIAPFQVQSIFPDYFQGAQISYASGTGQIVSNAFVAYPIYLRSANKPYSDAAITPALVANQTIVYCANIGVAETGLSGAPWLWLNTEGMTWWPATFGIQTLSFLDADSGCIRRTFRYWGDVPK